MVPLSFGKRVRDLDGPSKLKEYVGASHAVVGATIFLGFSFSIEYKKGSNNVTADALSWLPTADKEDESTQLRELTSSFMTN